MQNGSAFEYQYAIADHQGNTRVLFTSAAQTTQTVTATFESANQATEGTQFSNYPTASHINVVATNAHTGSNSLYLNGSSQGGQVGVAKSYKVYPGDQLSIKAYAKYLAPTNTDGNLAGFAAALLGAFSLPAPAQGEVGTPSAAINTWGGIEAAGNGDGSSDITDPRVFATIVIFDKNYKFLDVAYQQLTASDTMSASYKVKEAGYAFMYVSNENAKQVDVYIDDVTMSYTPSNILQGNEYYPFGMQTANSWTRDNTTNKFLYDGASELNSTTGMYDLPFRNYDAALGRFFQVDILAHTSNDFTPYHYARNNPIKYNDLSGNEADANVESDIPSEGENNYDNWSSDAGGGGGGGGGGEGGGSSSEESESASNVVVHWSVDNGDGTTTAGVTGEDGQGYVVTVRNSDGSMVDAQNADVYDQGNEAGSSGSFIADNGNGQGTGVSWNTVDGQFNVSVSRGTLTSSGTGIEGGTISGNSYQINGNGEDWIYDNNNTLGLGLEVAENGTSEAIQAIIANPKLYTAGAKIGATTLGTTVIGLNIAITGYTIANEIQGKNGASVNTHTWVNGGVTLLTTAATGVGIFFAGVTAPAWVPAVVIGGAVIGVGYAIGQVAGIDSWIDNNFGYK